MGFLTSFFSGALDQANKGFDNAAKEQLRVNEATLKRQEVVDAEAAKQSANAKKVADLARALQSTGVEPDKAFAVARYPGAANMKPDELVELASRMSAIPGQMTPAETQTRTIISPARTIQTPGIFTPPVKQPAITMTTGENQPPRQAYNITGMPRAEIMSTIDKFPPAATPEQAQAQAAVIEALRSNQLHIVTSELLQKAAVGAGENKPDQVYNQIVDELGHGIYRTADDAKAAYLQRGGRNQSADFSKVVIGGAKSSDAEKLDERKINALVSQGVSRDVAERMTYGFIRADRDPVTGETGIRDVVKEYKGGDTGELSGVPDVLKSAPSKMREAALAMPRKDKSDSNKELLDTAPPLALIRQAERAAKGNPTDVGALGQMKEYGGYAVEFFRVAGALFGAQSDWGKPIDEVVGASKAAEVRNKFRLMMLQISQPLLKDRQVSDQERALIATVTGGLDNHTTFEATMAKMRDMKDVLYVRAARHILAIPRLAPPDNLGPDNPTITDAYQSQLMQSGFSADDSVEIIRKLAYMQRGLMQGRIQ